MQIHKFVKLKSVIRYGVMAKKTVSNDLQDEHLLWRIIQYDVCKLTMEILERFNMCCVCMKFTKVKTSLGSTFVHLYSIPDCTICPTP